MQSFSTLNKNVVFILEFGCYRVTGKNITVLRKALNIPVRNKFAEIYIKVSQVYITDDVSKGLSSTRQT